MLLCSPFVHEALAQTRFTHFGHLVWHLPEGSRSETQLTEIEDHCGEHGIGLIRMRDPSVKSGCEILIDPVPKIDAADGRRRIFGSAAFG